MSIYIVPICQGLPKEDTRDLFQCLQPFPGFPQRVRSPLTPHSPAQEASAPPRQPPCCSWSISHMFLDPPCLRRVFSVTSNPHTGYRFLTCFYFSFTALTSLYNDVCPYGCLFTICLLAGIGHAQCRAWHGNSTPFSLVEWMEAEITFWIVYLGKTIYLHGMILKSSQVVPLRFLTCALQRIRLTQSII